MKNIFRRIIKGEAGQALPVVLMCLVVGSLMVIGGQTTLGTVTAFAGYVALMASPLSQISNLVSTALNAAAVSVVKYGFPVPQTKMITLPFSRCLMARRRI